jgi:hypothetical protein
LIDSIRAAALVLMVPVAVGAQPAGTFSPPRIIRAELPDLPAPTIVGGGEVLIEATVDRNGGLGRLIVLRSTPPYTDLVVSTLSRWRFQPARASNGSDPEEPVEAPILIAAVYRPPMLYNGPTLGEAPKELAVASGDVAYPDALIAPAYPPKAVSPAVLLFEVTLDQSGRIAETLPIASNAGFEGAAREALMQWKFRPGLVRGRPGPSTVYVVFGFQTPVVSSLPRLPLPPR